MTTCISGDAHALDRHRNCSKCGRYIPAPPMHMERTDTGSVVRYGEPADKDTPYILTKCSKCKLTQKLWMEGFSRQDILLQATLIGWNATQCCGAPMETETHNVPGNE